MPDLTPNPVGHMLDTKRGLVSTSLRPSALGAKACLYLSFSCWDDVQRTGHLGKGNMCSAVGSRVERVQFLHPFHLASLVGCCALLVPWRAMVFIMSLPSSQEFPGLPACGGMHLLKLLMQILVDPSWLGNACRSCHVYCADFIMTNSMLADLALTSCMTWWCSTRQLSASSSLSQRIPARSSPTR